MSMKTYMEFMMNANFSSHWVDAITIVVFTDKYWGLESEVPTLHSHSE